MNHKEDITANQNRVSQLLIMFLFVFSTFSQELVNSEFITLVKSDLVTIDTYPKTVYPSTDLVGFSFKRYEGGLDFSYENDLFSDVELRPFQSKEFNLLDYRFFIKE